MGRAARRGSPGGGGEGRSCRAQDTFLGMVPAAAARAAEVSGPGSGALPAPAVRPASAPAPRAPPRLGLARGRRGSPPAPAWTPRLCVCRSRRVSSRFRLLYKTAGRNRRRTPSPRSTSPPGVPSSPRLSLRLSSAALSPPRALPPSARVSGLLSGVTLLPLPGGSWGAAMIRNKEESFWVFFSFPLSLQSGLSACATSDLLGAPLPSLL